MLDNSGNGIGWCPRPDLNRHGLRHYPLKIACLPIPPLGHEPEPVFITHPAWLASLPLPGPRWRPVRPEPKRGCHRPKGYLSWALQREYP